MPRPWKFDEPLDNVIKIRCTSSERDKFLAMAEGTGLSVADVLRRKLLGLKIPDKTQLNTLFAVKNLERQLRKIGGLIKHIHSQPPAHVEQEEYSKTTLSLLREQEGALREITETLRRINLNDN